jgi:hypothetical protein
LRPREPLLNAAKAFAPEAPTVHFLAFKTFNQPIRDHWGAPADELPGQKYLAWQANGNN